MPNLGIVCILLFEFSRYIFHLFIEQSKSDGVKEEYTERGEEADGGPHDQELVPEPQQEVDLLVNDVLQQCQCLVFLHIMLCANHLCKDAEAVMELVRAPGPHVGHRAGHLGGEEAAQ